MAKEIRVEQQLPFDFCAQCDKFEPVMDVRKIYSMERNFVSREVVLGCRNDWLCRQLKDNLDDLMGGDIQ